MMLRLAYGVQQEGPELVGLEPKLLISVKVDARTRNQLDLLLNA
jgi:hypothetical protein